MTNGGASPDAKLVLEIPANPVGPRSVFAIERADHFVSLLTESTIITSFYFERTELCYLRMKSHRISNVTF